MRTQICMYCSDADTRRRDGLDDVAMMVRASAAGEIEISLFYYGDGSLTDNRPADDTAYLFVLHVGEAQQVRQATTLLRQFSLDWKRAACVLVHLVADVTPEMCDTLVEAYDNTSADALGALKIIRKNPVALNRMLTAGSNEMRSRLTTGYWRDFPGDTVLWLCNYSTPASNEERLNMFRAAGASVTIPLGVGVSMASLRYGLLNGEFPPQFRVLLLVHRTEGRADALAADLEHMDEERIARIFYCLYSDAGCGDADLASFRLALGVRAGQCQRFIRPISEVPAVNKRRLTDLFLSGADGFQLWDDEQRLLGEGPVLLTSLLILCQGYLAVHCGPADCPDGFTVDDVVGGAKTAVEIALRDKMKWGEVLRSAQGLTDALKSPDQKARAALQGEVCQASFWAVFDQAKKEDLLDTATKEWKGANGGCDRGKVEDLIKALPLKPGTSAHDGFARCVAEAYIELAKALGSVK